MKPSWQAALSGIRCIHILLNRCIHLLLLIKNGRDAVESSCFDHSQSLTRSRLPNIAASSVGLTWWLADLHGNIPGGLVVALALYRLSKACGVVGVHE